MMSDEPPSQDVQLAPRQATSAEMPASAARIMSPTDSPAQPPARSRASLRVASIALPSQPAALRQNRRQRLDRLLLDYCTHGPTAVAGLTGEIAKATLYRHLAYLVACGALERVGRRYRITPVGERWLADAQSHIDWHLFDHVYPPFALIPTPYHKALLELLLAAAVVRRAGLHADHLCAVVVMGSTLRWKTSLARMACATLGVDPNVSLIDLASEAGRSVFVRRTSDGHLRSERNVLSTPLVVFDDYLQADDAVRAAVRPFLSGRRTVPYEHGVITVDCVTLLTLNPRAKSTLEEQTTLTPAQLRRVILCNLDAVALPDLALTGHQALEAAVQHGPLTLPGLRTDLEAHREAVVQGVRDLVRPAMHDRIDMEMLRLLAAGMTAFIEDDARAIQQVLYDFGLTIETLGWARPGWVQAVREFSLVRPQPARRPSPGQSPSTPDTDNTPDSILLRRRIMQSDSGPYVLSEEARARLILMAADERISFSQAADVIIDAFTTSTSSVGGHDLHDLHSILELSKELKVRELPVKSVNLTLQLLAHLKESQLDFDDFDAALNLLARLHEFGLTTQSPEVTQILEVASELVTSGVSPLEVEQWLAQRPKASPR
jgi:hypothetical protein